MIFAPTPGPRVFAVPPGADFARSFAAGMLARLDGADPLGIPGIRLIVNTARAVAEIGHALADAAPGPMLLPRIETVEALGEDPLALPGAAEPEMARLLRLTRLTAAFLARGGTLAPPAAAPALARALMALEDELAAEGIDPARLDAATAGEFAEHWGRTLAFLRLIRDAGTAPAPPAKARQRAAAEALAAAWALAPPSGPVIAAGSTGSVGSTALLLAAIARLPQGAVVLPGFDPGIEPAIWANLTPEHPMAPVRPLLDALGLAPRDVALWHPGPHPAPARLALLHQALRPAPVTDAWQAARAEIAAMAPVATAGLALVEAESPRREAAAIALAVREALEVPGRTVAVVTPDAGLARRVAAELARFGVVPDDGHGLPLEASPAGTFLRLVAALDGSAAAALALLRHPMACLAADRDAHRALTRQYDLALRTAGPRPAAGPFPDWPDAPPEGAAWLAAARAALAPLAAARSLAAIAEAHAAAATALSAGAVWEGEDGAAARARMDEIIAHAPAHGPGAVPDWPGFLRLLLEGAALRPRSGERHPRVFLWGTAEARTRRADRMILAGLNDGTWPALPGADPWLSRPMRAAIGLPEPERLTGLAAHDFLGAAASGDVVLTRATRVEGAPTVPSRWLSRLANLLGGTDPAALAAMRARGARYLALQALTHRAPPVPRALRPNPVPPVAARPRKLSITAIERLVRDPYAAYAERVLGLRALDEPGRAADARERGEAMHRLVQRLTEETMAGWPVDPGALWDRLADEVIAASPGAASQRRLWRARMARLRAPFLAAEALRRQTDIPAAVEATARLDLPGGFTLTGRLDRIDRQDEGTAALYDYKTGALPSARQIGTFALQLHLGALLIARGGVAALGPMVPGHAAYLGLGPRAESRALEAPEGDFGPVVAEAEARLLALLAAYAAPWRGYLSRARLQHEGDDAETDHLARRAEWEDDAGEDAEAPP